MADIRIEENKYPDSEDTIIEVIGVDPKEDDILGLIHGLLEKKKDGAPSDGKEAAEFPEPDENGYMMRTRIKRRISIPDFKKAIHKGYLDELIKPYDEIDIECLNGREITIVCAYSSPNEARFIFKDCWDKGAMNDSATNKGGYYKSKGRKHVLEDIYPNLPKEWSELMKPRKMIEENDGNQVEYADLIWLPSATDIFGTTEYGFWEDLDDGFHLPIFRKNGERIKECGDRATYLYWLRSVPIGNLSDFWCVCGDGSKGCNCASWFAGFAPGFDIGK